MMEDKPLSLKTIFIIGYSKMFQAKRNSFGFANSVEEKEREREMISCHKVIIRWKAMN